jgi:intraflagellar transport protein 140
VEVDEYQNYEKALGALSEASRCLAKVTTPGDPVQHQRVLDNLNTRMAIVKRFVDIRRSEFSNA